VTASPNDGNGFPVHSGRSSWQLRQAEATWGVCAPLRPRSTIQATKKPQPPAGAEDPANAIVDSQVQARDRWVGTAK
jgi:hypothetical protein